MYRLRLIRHGLLKRCANQPCVTFERKLINTSVGNNPSGNPAPSPAKEPFRSSPGYAGFAIVLGGIASYALYELYTRDRSPMTASLNQQTFVPFLITAKEQVSPTSTIFTLRRGSQLSKEPYAALWTRAIWSVEFKQPQLQIARSYTPLPPLDTTDPRDLRFLIRKEHQGEVSNYLDRLRIGATIDARGPRVEYEIPENVSEVVFLAGGTGIAPAMQVVHALMTENAQIEGSPGLPNIHILWANRRRDDCVGGRTKEVGRWWWPFSDKISTPDVPPNSLVMELEDMAKKYEDHVTIDYLVDEEGTFIDKKRILRSIGGKTSSTGTIPTPETLSAPALKLLLVSGPDGFVDYFVGPRELRGGKQVQGPIRGVVGHLGLQDWSVVRL